MVSEPILYSIEAPADFREAFERSLHALRAALIEVLATVPGLPLKPYPMSRFLGLDKTLAWRVAQVVRAGDLAAAARHVPGQTGSRRLLTALEGHGAQAAELRATREAFDAFERMTATHAGDRSSLELMLGSGGHTTIDRTQALASRKLAFQGQSSTRGVRVRTHFALNVVAPNAENPTQLDVAVVGGLLGFQRLRPDVTWPLMRARVFAEGDSTGPQPLLGNSPLLKDFCSQPGKQLERRDADGSFHIRVPAGPVGQTAESDWVFGIGSRSFGSVHSEDEGGLIEFQYLLTTPAEVAVCDLLVHRDLPLEGAPQTKLVDLICGRPAFPIYQHAEQVVHLGEQLEEFGRPATMACTHVPRYRSMVTQACAHMGWTSADFRGYRLVLEYPPIPVAPVLVYPQLRPSS